MLGKEVVLKYTRELQFIYDPSVERGMHLLSVMDEIAASECENDCGGAQGAAGEKEK